MYKIIVWPSRILLDLVQVKQIWFIFGFFWSLTKTIIIYQKTHKNISKLYKISEEQNIPFPPWWAPIECTSLVRIRHRTVQYECVYKYLCSHSHDWSSTYAKFNGTIKKMREIGKNWKHKNRSYYAWSQA